MPHMHFINLFMTYLRVNYPGTHILQHTGQVAEPGEKNKIIIGHRRMIFIIIPNAFRFLY